MTSVGNDLLNEIQRVLQLREQYASMRGLPQANVEPIIHMIDIALARATDALTSIDRAEVVAATEELKGFKE